MEAPREVLKASSAIVLYISPSPTLLKITQEKMIRAAVCKQGSLDACQCPDCYTVIKGKHPDVEIVEAADFIERMSVLYSYPPAVTVFSNLQEVSLYQQMRILIWLESMRHRKVIMTALSDQHILPTIRSRAMIYREVLKFSMSEEERNTAFYQVKALFEGKAKIEDWPQELHPTYAANISLLLVEELERRLANLQRMFPAPDSELQTLLKLVMRYLDNIQTHNLSLLLKSYSTLALQNVR